MYPAAKSPTPVRPEQPGASSDQGSAALCKPGGKLLPVYYVQSLAGTGNAHIEQIPVQGGTPEVPRIRVVQDHVGELHPLDLMGDRHHCSGLEGQLTRLMQPADTGQRSVE